MNKMPINKKEKIVYTFLMVVFMVIAMTTYNVFLHEGFSIGGIKNIWLLFPLTFLVAFLVEWFLVAPVAFRIATKLVNKDESEMKKGLVTAFCFVAGMVISMSLYGSILMHGFSIETIFTWGRNICFNFIVAFPIQVFIARPIIGIVFRTLFPIGTIVDLSKISK